MDTRHTGTGHTDTRPSVLLIREWEQQMSSSGCCGRLEGDFLLPGSGESGERVFAERRERMEAMGPLYRAVRSRFGSDVELEVIDPRNLIALMAFLVRDFRRYGVPVREALWTLTHIPVQGVIVNGRLVARGAWPPAEPFVELVERASAGR